MSTDPPAAVTVGILALQGAFLEHQAMLSKLSYPRPMRTVLVKTPADLAKCEALIVPGGESTTIALLARLAGLLELLREFVQKKPVWGTCAGAILLADSVKSVKKGGQETFGGVSIAVERNGWGTQMDSFEAPLVVEDLREPERPFSGVFIRAPLILELLPAEQSGRPPIHILARLSSDRLPRWQTAVRYDEDDTDPTDNRTIVAIRQGHHLVTTFHPELTKDDRFHDYFVRHCVMRSI